MASHRELEKQIRYQLNQLGARNAHHDFEHLCRDLARTRICSNIMPATGPVAAGGDQGRDFETYQTSLGDPFETSLFVGSTTDKRLVFACTLQKDSVPSKIRSDVKTIVGTGRPVDVVHYFCECDIPVAKRHELQSWASTEHEIDLEIHDGQWIAMELRQRDILWIAQEYLGIPRESFPEFGDESYEELRLQWEGHLPSNLADFVDIVGGLRQAYAPDGPNQDLPFWLERADPAAVPEQLRRYAIYETAVASLKGLGTMRGLETFIEEYFTSAYPRVWDADLEDSAILLGFCRGASAMGQLSITTDTLTEFAQGLLEKIDELRTAAQTPGRKANLLFIRGMAASMKSAGSEGIAEGIDNWTEALDYAEKAPLLPLGSLSDMLGVYLELAPQGLPKDLTARVLALAEKLDALIEKRYGAFESASRCRDRAMALYNSGDILGAIELFHRAKTGWFAEETLRGSILAILMLARCYGDLGLQLAAKYYSLAAAFMAGTAKDLSLRKYVSDSLFSAAESDYCMGAWCSFILLSEVALSALDQFGTSLASDTEEGPVFRTLFHAGIAHALAQCFVPHLRASIRDVLEAWDIVDDLNTVLEAADAQWCDKETNDVLTALHHEGLAGVFNDAYSPRCAQFLALGVRWSIAWDNSYASSSMGEHFVAVLQVLLADVAKLDLCMLPTTMSVKLKVQDGVGAGEFEEGEHPGEWIITLPMPTPFEEFEPAAFAATTWLLACASALPMEESRVLIDSRLEKALLSKTFCARPYEELLETFLKADSFARFDRKTAHLIDEQLPSLPTHPQLAGASGSGPGYSESDSLEAVKRRYSILPKKLGVHLTWAADRPVFQAAVAALRQEGWKDWHLLLALYNSSLNYIAKSADERSVLATQQDLVARANDLDRMDSLPAGVAIPDSELGEGSLRSSLRMSMVSTFRSLNLELHGRAVDQQAVEQLLSQRYGYWIDDIDHEDLGF